MKTSALVLMSLLSLRAAADEPFTLEQVMSAPFASQLTAARQGSRVAWVLQVRGVRNVWVADGPRFAATARAVTKETADDGQAIASLRLTPDGRTVLYARGGELNDKDASPNPESRSSLPKQQVFALDVATPGAAPRLLGDMACGEEDCEDIQVSPDGKRAVWAARKKLWIAELAAKQPAKELPVGRGVPSQPRWSPDSGRLAYVSTREAHSFIGVHDFGGSTERVLAPSVDRDSLPRWSRDGKLVAFVRRPAVEQRRPLVPVVAEPWAVWVADASTGVGRELWRSGSALDDSFPEITAEGSFHFADGRLVFASEKDGRNHLYAIAVEGGAPVLLTPGAYDVEDVTLSPDGKTLVYSSNEGDAERRHLWRVGVDGAAPRQELTGRPNGENSRSLMGGETVEWSPVVTGDGASVVCLGSGATTPGGAYVVAEGGRTPIAPQSVPPEFPAERLVTPRTVVFPSADGLEVHGQLFVPRGEPNGKRPGLLFLHGGPIRQMLPAFHYMDYYHDSYAENQYLASRGYVVLSVNYRLGIMYGRHFREAPDTVWRGAAEYEDVVAAARWLKSQPEVDGSRIGLWGGSYGGFLTAMGLARNSDLFAAGVDLHGVHDWSVFLTEEPFFGNLARKPPDAEAAVKLALASSPVSAVDRWKSPVLLIHGDDDRNVPFDQTVDLVARLRARGVPFEQMVLPDEIHGFLLWRSWIRVYKATADFFDRTLKR